MDRLSKLLGLLLILVPCSAQMIAPGPIMRTIAGGGAAPTYLFDEDFEGTGFENSWTIDLGSPNPDDTSPVASGSQSLNITANQRLTCNTTWTAPATAYTFFAVYMTSVTVTDASFQARNNGTTLCWQPQFRSDGYMRWYHGANYATTSGTWSTGQWIYVWVEFTASTGTDNGTLNVYLSTTTTKPGSPDVQVTNGTATVGHNSFYIRLDENQDYNLDHILVDDAAIGSAP